jgi:hypothetical protein
MPVGDKSQERVQHRDQSQHTGGHFEAIQIRVEMHTTRVEKKD